MSNLEANRSQSSDKQQKVVKPQVPWVANNHYYSIQLLRLIRQSGAHLMSNQIGITESGIIACVRKVGLTYFIHTF